MEDSILRNLPLFKSLKDDEINVLVQAFKLKKFEKDDYIFMEGEDCSHFHLLAEGLVRILKHASTGKDFTAEIILPGHFFGTLAFFSTGKMPATAQAISDSVVFQLPANIFRDILIKHPETGSAILTELSERMKSAHETAKNISYEAAITRIEAVFLKLYEKFGKNSIPLTRQDIAQMAGVTVETSIRIISQFKKKGIIDSTERGFIRIENPGHFQSGL